MVEGAFRGIADAFVTMFFLCCIFVPLGVWKLVEIIIWCFNHISLSIV